MLHHQSPKRSHKQRCVSGRIDIAAYLADSHSLFDQLLHRQTEIMVRFGHLAANLLKRSERLADQHVHSIAITGRCRAQVSLGRYDQCLQPMKPRQRGLQKFCELTLEVQGGSAYQLALRPEPMADESVAVARQLADFHQGSAAASLALDQLERGIEHSLI